MKNFNKFFKSLLNNSNINIDKDLSLKKIRFIISKINEYFYTHYDGIGHTNILDKDFEYFSEFHKFWKQYHEEILNPTIDETQCEKVAESLHNIFKKFDGKPFYELYDVGSLSPEAICKIRYFTANQDFRGTRDFGKFAKLYLDDPSIFDKRKIKQNPEDFLKNLGLTSLSQSDKRIKYAVTASNILIEKNIEPYNLIEICNNDIQQVKELLLNNLGSGFGNKKIDMFLRDMVVLNVWKNTNNFDKINVASDINTVKVALRTKILKTEIVLLSSFLDIFCYQYDLIDRKNAQAWRKVWEIWNNKYPKECVESPCLIDYLVYRIIGKNFCKETLTVFRCESEKHEFKWHSSRNRTCQICYKKGKNNKAFVIRKMLPCSDSDGNIVIEKSKFVTGNDAILPGIKNCPFISICNPQSKTFKKLNPPKSISILGRTGWESAKTKKDEGGGGLMS